MLEVASTPSVDQFREMVRLEWEDLATVNAWRKWYPKMEGYYRPLTDAIVDLGQIGPGQTILELASGQGDPAMTLSRIAGKTGHVTLTDQSAEMLKIARDRAAAAGLANLSFRETDAHRLPFPDQCFDRVTCRLGAMYFADCQQALKEARRVLKLAGRAVFVVWGPPDQNPLSPLFARVPVPAAPAGMPEPFRFSDAHGLERELTKAGFRGIRNEARSVMLPWPGPPEELWLHLYEIVTPLKAVLESLPAAVIEGVIEDYRKGFDGETTVTPTTIMAVSGER